MFMEITQTRIWRTLLTSIIPIPLYLLRASAIRHEKWSLTQGNKLLPTARNISILPSISGNGKPKATANITVEQENLRLQDSKKAILILFRLGEGYATKDKMRKRLQVKGKRLKPGYLPWLYPWNCASHQQNHEACLPSSIETTTKNRSKAQQYISGFKFW